MNTPKTFVYGARNLSRAIILMAGVILAFCFIACPGDIDPGPVGPTPPTPPEYQPDAKRWSTWKADDSTATVDIEVDDDDVCAITVGGTAMDALPAWDNVWKVNAAYAYTAVKGKTYVYTFEAWTDGADRTMNVQWYNDWVNNDIHNTGYENEEATFTITSEQKTYTIKASDYGFGPIPKSGTHLLEFQCANQTGTFYVKIISIGLPDSERWSKWKADDSTATVAIEVDDDDVCAVTVGGTAMTAMPAWDNVWKVNAGYEYTAVKGKIYTFEFEAWTDGADRTMTIQWYNDWASDVYQNTGYEDERATFTITSTPTTYTITNSDYGFGPIPKNGVQTLEFQCANQTGKFYVKIISITSKYSKTDTDGGGDDGDGGGIIVGPVVPLLTWTRVDNAFDYTNIEIAYGGGMFVAVGESGKMAYSSDGMEWTMLPSNEIFAAGGYSGKTAYSDDGINWTEGASIYAGSIAYGDGKFVADGGGYDDYGTYIPKMSYSSDGINWADADVSNIGFTALCYDIAYGGGKFVAVGASGMAYSSDGITWTAVEDSTVGTSAISNITYGNGIFVAAIPSVYSSESKKVYSSDGINWAIVPDSTGSYVYYGGSKFVDYSGKAYSSDGINWTKITSNMGFDCIAYGNGRFVGTKSGSLGYSNLQE